MIGFRQKFQGYAKQSRNFARVLDENPSAGYRDAEVYVCRYRFVGSGADADGTRVIRYNRIMRAAICGRKSGRVRGKSTQCFAAGEGTRVLDYKLHRPQRLLSRPNDTLVSLSSREIIDVSARLLTGWNFNERADNTLR